MAEGPDDLVLEQLRIMRAEAAAVRSDVLAEVAALRCSLTQRLDLLQGEVRGVTYVMTASLGSVLADIQDPKERVGRLEKI